MLSNIPTSLSELLPLEPLPTRLRPLFSVGVHDIPILSHGSRTSIKATKDDSSQDLGYGWVACTTDDVLAMKESLYDILVTIPPSYTAQAKEKVWPKIESPRGREVRATQRDLRRYRTLRTGLRIYTHTSKGRESSRGHSQHASSHRNDRDRVNGVDNGDDNDNGNQTSLLLDHIENTQETFDDASSTLDAKLIEPQSWSALAYSSFMWWASAGEKRTDMDEESEHDAALLDDRGGDSRSMSPNRPRSGGRRSSSTAGAEGGVGMEMAVVAYFQRLTGLILGTLAECVEGSDDPPPSSDHGSETDHPERVGEGGGPGGGKVFVGCEDMVRMGLDVWSEGDRRFVQELVTFYWGREAEVGALGVECCGVRVC